MCRPKGVTVILLVVSLVALAPLVRAQENNTSAAEAKQAEREAMYYRYREFPSLVKGGSIEPHWMADGSSFWYAEGAPANTVIYKVDPKANTKEPLFETARLRQALKPLLGHESPYKGLPFEEFTFVDEGETAVKFTVEGKDFILQLHTYTISRGPAVSEEEKSRMVPRVIWEAIPSYRDTVREVMSPDHRWIATLKDHNLWLRSTSDGRYVQLTADGIEDYAWGGYWEKWAWWSPDSYWLAVKKGDYRKVAKVPIVHYLKPREEVEWLPHSDHEPRAWVAAGRLGAAVPQARRGRGEIRPDGSKCHYRFDQDYFHRRARSV